MKCVDDLAVVANKPRLIPSYKQSERRLLSIFMALLDMSPTIRGLFLSRCEYPSGKSATYQSYMEVTYNGSKYLEVRPDGLIACNRGKKTWAAFIEAKSEKSPIRVEQIQEYAKLAEQADVDSTLTISNEFAREPHELPYNLAQNKRRSKKVFHFAWADIRTFLELEKNSPSLSDAERYVVHQCLEYFWEESSGIRTYDAMPESWPAFVEASSTALGFNSKIKGFSEIIYGWQQERRDLASKLTHRLQGRVSLRHVSTGIRSSEDERQRADKAGLADDYILTARYFLEKSKTNLDITADLRACRISTVLDITLPENKGAKAIGTWLAKRLTQIPNQQINLVFDWPGHKYDMALPAAEFLLEPGIIATERKDAPRAVRAVLSRHGVRRFKSRKMFIEDVEQVTNEMVDLGIAAGWIE